MSGRRPWPRQGSRPRAPADGTLATRAAEASPRRFGRSPSPRTLSNAGVGTWPAVKPLERAGGSHGTTMRTRRGSPRPPASLESATRSSGWTYRRGTDDREETALVSTVRSNSAFLGPVASEEEQAWKSPPGADYRQRRNEVASPWRTLDGRVKHRGLSHLPRGLPGLRGVFRESYPRIIRQGPGSHDREELPRRKFGDQEFLLAARLDRRGEQPFGSAHVTQKATVEPRRV